MEGLYQLLSRVVIAALNLCSLNVLNCLSCLAEVPVLTELHLGVIMHIRHMYLRRTCALVCFGTPTSRSVLSILATVHLKVLYIYCKPSTLFQYT